MSADHERRADVLVVGGGLGGVAAALAAGRRGLHVIVSEPTRWIGGVLTNQAVPPDEHPWIEQFGCTATYRAMRNRIRAFYQAHYPLTAEARARPALNPGAARVSGLASEPRVTLAVLEAMLAPLRAAGRVEVLLRHTPTEADVDGDTVRAVSFDDLDANARTTIQGRFVIDATEIGELLPLAGAEHVTGAESRERTGEPHAPAEAQPLNLQPVSVCFALDHRPGEDHTVERPERYDEFKRATAVDWPQGRFSLIAPDPKTRAPVHHTLKPDPGDDPAQTGPDYDDARIATRDDNLWTFRRILARRTFVPGAFDGDVTLVNWPQMDFWEAPVLKPADAHPARELSLSFLYWLQTEAPRPDGGAGFPGLRLRGDVTGDAPDGLAIAPYIREARRIVAEHTITEQEIALDVRGEHGAVRHRDSVGIGSYRIDLHPSTGGDPYIDIGCCPFELPLGALLPVRLENLLPGARNIGTTHVTNGSHRLPPIEWNTGEVAGHLAAFCIENGTRPRAVRANDNQLDAFQRELAAAGVELRWPRVAGY